MAKSLWLLVLALLAQADLYGQTTAPVSPEKQFAGDILQHQDRAMNVLLGWSGLSAASGAVMLSSNSRRMRDFG